MGLAFEAGLGWVLGDQGQVHAGLARVMQGLHQPSSWLLGRVYWRCEDLTRPGQCGPKSPQARRLSLLGSRKGLLAL